MIKTTKKEVLTSEAVELFNVLQQTRTEDDVMSFVFMKNLQVLKPIADKFEDEKNKAMLNNAKESEGILMKDEKGNLEYGKSDRLKLDDDIQSLKNVKVKVEFETMPITIEATKLPIHLKARLLDTIFIMEKPELKSV